MIINQTSIPECFYVQHIKYEDTRGSFAEIYRESIIPIPVPQINYSISKKSVLRGIHRTPYGKFVTCVSGEIYDICLDLRPKSPTYKKYFSIILSPNYNNSIYIPPYCGHAFLALEDSVVVYAQSAEYQKSYDETYCYKLYDIQWPIDPAIISPKDKAACELDGDRP